MKSIDIVSIFPEIIDLYLQNSPITKSIPEKDIIIKTHQLRNFSEDKHSRVDDKQYGGEPRVSQMTSTLKKSFDYIK